MPTHVSAGVSGNKSLPDPIPYPLFLETIKGSRYSTFPDPPPNRKEGSGKYSTSSHYGLAVAMDSAPLKSLAGLQ